MEVIKMKSLLDNAKYLSSFILFILLQGFNYCNAQADLTVDNIQGFPGTISPGDVIFYTFDLNNVGTETATGNYTIRKYLSTDGYYSENDIEVGYVPTGYTPVGTISNVEGGITVPESIEGNYRFLVIVVDADDQIAESDETNNASARVAYEVMLPYAEKECQHLLGFKEKFLCHSIIRDGYEIYTEKEGVTTKHIVDLSGNVLSSEVYEIETNSFVNKDERKFEEKDFYGNLLNSRDLPDYLFEGHDARINVVELVTGEFLFYYLIKTDPGTIGFTSTMFLIKTTNDFEHLATFEELINDSSESWGDRIQAVIPTDDGGFYVDYKFNLPTWSNYYYSYLLKYDSDGNSMLLHNEQAWDIEIQKTPCGVKRLDKYNGGSFYSGVNNVKIYWNNNANTITIGNNSSGRYGAYSTETIIYNPNVQYNYAASNNGVHTPPTFTVYDDGETYVYQNTGLTGYALKGNGPTFLAFSTIDEYLTISQYPCETACNPNTEEIENLDFTHIGSLGDSDYYLANFDENMYAIDALSEEYDLNLASIDSEEENDFLFNSVSAMTYIGLNDSDQEGVLTWSTGDAVSYQNFDDDCVWCGTNNELNDRVVMNLWNGKWSWVNAWSRRPFIIEVSCGNLRPSLRMANLEQKIVEHKFKVGDVYPNPSAEMINIPIDKDQYSKSELAIFNSMGIQVFRNENVIQEDEQNLRIDVSQYPTGMYLIHIMNDGEKIVRKFMKN